MALTIEAAEAKIKFYEEQKKLLARRDTEVPELVEKLASYSNVLTVPQRRRIAKLVGGTLDEDAAAPAKKAPRKVAKTVAPKYRLPSGETWAGRGRVSSKFLEWENSEEGKAWQAANPGQRFPLIDQSTAKKVAKKVAKKGTKTARKKVAKKAAS